MKKRERLLDGSQLMGRTAQKFGTTILGRCWRRYQPHNVSLLGKTLGYRLE